MGLQEILNNEKLSDAKKVKAIAKVVAAAREAYGNEDADITAPEINTINGLEDLNMLCNESKLAIAESEITNIRVVAVEYTKAFEGAVLDKKVEELIAISPVLANITATVKSAYL